MVLQINPSQMALWRKHNQLQIGVGPNCTRLSNLSEGRQRLLTLLYRGIPDDYFDEAAQVVGAENASWLLAQVSPHLLEKAGHQTQLSAEFIEKRFAEICRAQASFAIEGSAVLEMRQLGRVFIQGPSQTSDLIADSLQAAGVGHIHNQPSDFNDSDRFDLAILINQNLISPADYARFMNRAIDHISIVFDAEGVSVSPVIENSQTPCLTCYHENLSDKDNDWPALATQLLFSKLEFDDSTARLFAAALASQRALQQIDRPLSKEPASKIGYRLNIATGAISEFDWPFNSNCLCRVS